MTTQAKKVASSIAQFLSWAYQTAKTLWIALRPVWNVLTTVWENIKSALGKLGEYWDFVVGLVKDFYQNYIKPIWDFIEPAFDAVNNALDWLNNLYNATIGKIENVYDLLFGKFEETWARITETEEKFSRAIAVFSDEMAAKLDAQFDKITAQTIGRVRDLKDELLHDIDDLYGWAKTNLNELYWSLKDIIDPMGNDIKAINDLLDIRFDKSGSLSEDTVVKSADTYGQEWWGTLEQQYTTSDMEPDVEIRIYSETERHIDEVLEDLKAGGAGAYGDIADFIDEGLTRLKIGMDPPFLEIQRSLLPIDETKYYDAAMKGVEP